MKFPIECPVSSDISPMAGTALGAKELFQHSYQMQVFCASNYHFATPALAAGARNVDIYKGEKFSDHAPVTIEYA
jgi:hypothetical protein